MFPLKTCYTSILLLVTCTTLAHCILEPSMPTDAYVAEANVEKTDDAIQVHKRPSFFVGSRYGRSGGNTPLFAPSKARRLSVVPRNDRFFLGSRYGKRSGEYMSPYEQDVGSAAATATQTGSNNKSFSNGDGNVVATAQQPYMMSCVYTGLRNLYHCNNIEEINNIINQLTTAQNDDDKRK